MIQSTPAGSQRLRSEPERYRGCAAGIEPLSGTRPDSRRAAPQRELYSPKGTGRTRRNLPGRMPERGVPRSRSAHRREVGNESWTGGEVRSRDGREQRAWARRGESPCRGGGERRPLCARRIETGRGRRRALARRRWTRGGDRGRRRHAGGPGANRSRSRAGRWAPVDPRRKRRRAEARVLEGTWTTRTGNPPSVSP